MGRYAKPASGGMTKYYWYPGERSDWIRAAVAGGCGFVTIVLVVILTGSHLWAAMLGTSVTAGVAGMTFGRKDVRALHSFCGFAALDTGRAVWRALVKGFGAAMAAVLVVHAADGQGFVSSWLLPVVPAIVGAIAHQGGMMYERASLASAERAALDAEAATLDISAVEIVPAGSVPAEVVDAQPATAGYLAALGPAGAADGDLSGASAPGAGAATSMWARPPVPPTTHLEGSQA
jgi:hypothetical protein